MELRPVYKMSVIYAVLLLLLILAVQMLVGGVAYLLVPQQAIVIKLIILIVSQLISYSVGIYLFYWRGGQRFNFAKRSGFSGGYMLLLALGLSVFAVNTLTLILDVLPQSPEVMQAFEELSQIPLFAVFLIVIFAPIFEELIFRGIILNGLKNCYNKTVALIFSSLLFGAFHMNLQQFISASLIGVVCGILYLLTNSLRYPIVFHALYNFSVTLVGGILIESGINDAAPYFIGVIALVVVPVALVRLRGKLNWDESRSDADA